MIDIFAAFLLLIILFLPLFGIFLLVWGKLGSPVLFTQVRPGIGGKPFRMFKFRTMTNERTLQGELLPDYLRLTKFGVFLRSTSLDELPELWNVLRGDMSLVGPRPLLMEYLPLYSEDQARRHQVRPGITGWAQVNGRNAIAWEEKFKLDIWYIDNNSIFLDIKILLLTIKKVFLRQGVNSSAETTMPIFDGQDQGGIKKNET